ncbi:hypothetical protein O181_068550 [Austropuccinia psidii MF-1]|uniref:Uncharacterized protein n=1 Tax=Austropuccinia psidii MF-1 TaxID=1389203 RepID=A0A9Q3I763_9BASI|nr:hypothetical protein [Austropuccinia psidii MF-1]
MPVQNSPPARKTRSQAKNQAFLTPTPRTPFDSTPEVPKLRAQLDRGPQVEGEEEESDGTEGVPAPVGESQSTGGPTLAQSNKTISHQSEPSLFEIIQKMTQIMANLQEASSSEA